MSNVYGMKDKRTTLPAGKYYVGDPCYVIDDDEWMDCLDATCYLGLYEDEQAMGARKCNQVGEQLGVFSCINDDGDEFLFAASGTQYGDGAYPCMKNDEAIGECGVDAGLIAAIPVDMIPDEWNNGLGVVVEIDQDFVISCTEGTISFGDVEVLTGDDGDEGYW